MVHPFALALVLTASPGPVPLTQTSRSPHHSENCELRGSVNNERLHFLVASDPSLPMPPNCLYLSSPSTSLSP
jgi:hypothetical protein